jgi:hypothetical protein
LGHHHICRDRRLELISVGLVKGYEPGMPDGVLVLLSALLRTRSRTLRLSIGRTILPIAIEQRLLHDADNRYLPVAGSCEGCSPLPNAPKFGRCAHRESPSHSDTHRLIHIHWGLAWLRDRFWWNRGWFRGVNLDLECSGSSAAVSTTCGFPLSPLHAVDSGSSHFRRRCHSATPQLQTAAH